MKLNKDEIQLFEKKYIEEYCNLEIYPQVGILEQEAGLLNDFCGKEIIIHGNVTNYFKDNIKSCDQNDIKISYIHESIKKFELIKLTDVILSLENEYFDKKFFRKVKIHGLVKIL
jgi:hypothetical protein